ncbi:hypothetical protein SeMB42_g05518 [Synchytrium endobioticum]|uniref:RNA helicase n=1 Tax=Synchytrium endobioticum TaxID=286115 RepID=A0A507CWC8_9FUNG|nr:hypothetical protein SeMB42_g05518 [Synchytrium endobioticum]TPX43180.1 hypothetical protein SeLEV6574_g05201 [Synchytrium endobioticum]
MDGVKKISLDYDDSDLFGDDEELLEQGQEEAEELKIVAECGDETVDKVQKCLNISDTNNTASWTPSTTTSKPKEWAHMVDMNAGFPEFHELLPDMALHFPFELDVFQKHAVYRLERGESVLVAAHTSAGKTVVAEYAIALAKKHHTRVVYTSPIKALSNQKFRDFKLKFDNVGILTGDVQINPEANCLVMTTEILRSMLYRGADIIRDVEFVVFDEVHYINDIDRGVVWEEVIIMLPPTVTMILLSATVPNTKEFAEWLGRTKQKDVYVISTPKRPVPLEHFLYVKKEIYKIVGPDKKFIQKGWKDSNDIINPPKEPVKPQQHQQQQQQQRGGGNQRGGRGGGPSNQQQRGGRGGQQQQRGRGSYSSGSGAMSSRGPNPTSDKQLYTHLIGGLLRKKELLPVIIFSFSRKKVEEYAEMLSSTDLTSGASEKSEIHLFIERCYENLKGTDKELPQVLRTRELLSRGIAVHHSGLLPIIKEMVEILFAKGLVKVLFATETFAMGVNAPARCVVFSSTRKHDGREFRDLLPGEYTQMAGRAGRRGLDDSGVVLIVVNSDMPSELSLKTMILGTPTKLASQFRLTYNMILNLLRVQVLRVEDMIRHSFSENARQLQLPQRKRDYEEAERILASIPKLPCPICRVDLSDYYDVSAKIMRINEKVRERVMKSPMGAKVMTPGRIVVLNTPKFRHEIAVILMQAPSTNIPTFKSSVSGSTEVKSYIVLILTRSSSSAGADGRTHNTESFHAPLPATRLKIPGGDDVASELKTITHADISIITKSTIKDFDAELITKKRDEDEMEQTAFKLYTVGQEFLAQGEAAENDWSKFKDLDFQELLVQKADLLKQLSTYHCNECPDMDAHYGRIHEEKELQYKMAELAYKISDQNLAMLPEYQQRVEVMKRLNYVDENGVVQLKGRVACEINTANELILTELILDNTFAEYEPAEVVALLSALVFQDKSDVQPKLGDKLVAGRKEMDRVALAMYDIQEEYGIEGQHPETLRYGLVQVVYEWARGTSFRDITEMSDVLEGTIVRCIVRLDETCREVRGAAKLIGDATLHEKMEQASALIKRDIVFSPSLYF